jgi:uncharacterized membrane protein (Fun14 family)
MSGDLTRAVKCFFRCPACALSVMLSPAALSDRRVVETLKQTCPDVDLGSLGFYMGFFLALLFVIFCIIAYLFFNVLRVFMMHGLIIVNIEKLLI